MHIIREDIATYKMPFGKFKDKRLGQINPYELINYLLWAMSQEIDNKTPFRMIRIYLKQTGQDWDENRVWPGKNKSWEIAK